MNALGKTVWTVLSVAALLVGACSTTANDGGSETNWVACDEDSPCSVGFECRGGYCKADTGAEAGVNDGARVTSVFSDLIQFGDGSGGEVGLYGRCVPRSLDVVDGQVSCSVVEATRVTEQACDCARSGRAPVSAAERPGLVDSFRQAGACGLQGTPSCDALCLCSIIQLEGTEMQRCQNEPEPVVETEGWCYVDPAQGVGDPSLVANCKNSAEQRLLRFLVSAAPRTHVVFSCNVSSPVAPISGDGAPLGSPCVPSDDAKPDFPGYSVTEVTIESGGTQCASGTCIAAYFNGRVGCPYGQVAGEGACMTSGPNPVPVTVAVEPQYVVRSPESSVYCSCRCDGPGPGPFCTCPSGYSCGPLVLETFGSAGDDFDGSYCVKDGTLVTAPWTDIPPGDCSAVTGNCEGR